MRPKRQVSPSSGAYIVGKGRPPPSRRGVSCVILFLRRAFLPCKSSVMVVSPYACWAAREQLGLAFVRLPAVLSGWP
jgi:hypothetical protein